MNNHGIHNDKENNHILHNTDSNQNMHNDNNDNENQGYAQLLIEANEKEWPVHMFQQNSQVRRKQEKKR